MKKSKEHIQVQVGAFMAIGILLFMMAIFFLGSKMNLLQKYYNLVCYFDKVNGLRVGAPVQLAGINVGHIDSISFEDRLVEGEENKLEKQLIVKVKAVMKIDGRYKDRIRADSVASIQTQGLLGDRMVFLTVGTQESQPLENGQIVENVVNPSGFNQLVFEGNDLIQKAKTLLDNSSGFIHNTDSLVAKLNTVMGEFVYDNKHKRTFTRIDNILGNFEVASYDLKSVTEKINHGEGTLGSLVNDDSLFQDLKMLFGKANRNKLIRSVIRYTLETKEKDHLK